MPAISLTWELILLLTIDLGWMFVVVLLTKEFDMEIAMCVFVANFIYL